MKKLAITKAGLSAFSNAMHVELHTRILTTLNDLGVASLGLDAQTVKDYTTSIAKEQDYVNHSYSSLWTPEILKARTLRDQWYRYIRSTIEAAQYSPVTSRATAYSTLNAKLLKVYPALRDMADGQNATAQIRGFVQTAQTDCKAQLELFNLTDAVSTLSDCNEDFAKKYQERNSERAQAIPAEMAQTRTETDALYRRLSYVLQGQAYLTSDDEAKQKVYTNCATAVDEIGTLLGDWQYRLRLSRKNAVVAPTEGSSEDLAGDTGNTAGDAETTTESADSATALSAEDAQMDSLLASARVSATDSAE
jgi:hypothetical protein